jgi:glycogen(starch) synthase
MRVFMLGWEFPPHISGGLGTACEGLTSGLARHGVDVTFVVPELFGGEKASHVELIDSHGRKTDERGQLLISEDTESEDLLTSFPARGGKISVKRVPAMLQPYFTTQSFRDYVTELQELARQSSARGAQVRADLKAIGLEASGGFEEADEKPQSLQPAANRKPGAHYTWDMFGEVSRYTARLTSLFAADPFDVIHAHDWMTFPAGVALKQVSGKPLVVHTHSLEFDRSGSHVNQQIFEIERLGLEAADVVVAVSYYTRRIIHEQYKIPLEKVTVVHNGVYSEPLRARYRAIKKWPSRVVLFLGRITFQKGPDYFVEAAAKVIPHVPDVIFVMAGTGDMRQRMIDRVNELGLSQHFFFPGFLKGQEVEEMFSLADVYVMPSVSEPFGLSALEAIKFETPVIISRQSGVSEVLSHALKVDFWDTERLADLMINALQHEELRADLVAMAREEVRRLHWEASALRTIEVYRRLI